MEICELVEQEGPARVHTDCSNEEEVLPDGTVCTRQIVRRHSLRYIKKHILSENLEEEHIFEGEEIIPGSECHDMIETFKEPARNVIEKNEVEKVLPSGEKVKRRVNVMRMVQTVKTRKESFDEVSGHQEEEYEIDEVIPGTECCFLESDSDEDTSEESDNSEEGYVENNNRHIHMQESLAEQGVYDSEVTLPSASMKSNGMMEDHGEQGDGSSDEDSGNYRIKQKFLHGICFYKGTLHGHMGFRMNSSSFWTKCMCLFGWIA